MAAHKICEYLACSPGVNVLVVECSGGNSRPSCPSGVGGGTLGNRKISSSVAVNPRPAQSSFGHVFDQLVNSYRAAMAPPTSAPLRLGMSILLKAPIFLNPRMLPHVPLGVHPAKRSGTGNRPTVKNLPGQKPPPKTSAHLSSFWQHRTITQVPPAVMR